MTACRPPSPGKVPTRQVFTRILELLLAGAHEPWAKSTMQFFRVGRESAVRGMVMTCINGLENETRRTHQLSASTRNICKSGFYIFANPALPGATEQWAISTKQAFLQE